MPLSPPSSLYTSPLQMFLSGAAPQAHVVINFTEGEIDACSHYCFRASRIHLLVKLTHQGQWSFFQGPNCPYLQSLFLALIQPKQTGLLLHLPQEGGPSLGQGWEYFT